MKLSFRSSRVRSRRQPKRTSLSVGCTVAAAVFFLHTPASAQWTEDPILGQTYRAYAPWIFSEVHGWLYESPVDSTQAWYCEPGSDWFYATSAAPGWFYSIKHDGWIQLVQYGPRVRWFWDYQQAAYAAEPGAEATDMDRTVMADIDFMAGQLRKLVDDVPQVDAYPSGSSPDSLAIVTVAPNHWVAGYFPSELWLMYGFTGGEFWHHEAEQRTAPLLAEMGTPGIEDNAPADLNSMAKEPFLLGWQLTGETKYSEGLVKAASLFNDWYNVSVGGFRSWNWGQYSGNNFTIIMDATMSLEMNLVAHDLPGGDPVWYDRTLSAADLVRDNLVRANGSSYHLGIWNPNTGTLTRRGTYQGYSDTSTWARGQAWGVHSFAMLALRTGESRYAETSKKLADYFMAHLESDGIPRWDFDAPVGSRIDRRDTSAAAIAAAGLLKLSVALENAHDPEAAKYRDDALQLIQSLSSPTWLATDAATDFTLLHGTGNGPNNQFNQCLMYGDFHFLEALLLYMKTEGLY